MENRRLYQQFLNGQCTSEELDQLFRYFGTANEAELKDIILAELDNANESPITKAEQEHLQSIHGRLTQQLFEEKKTLRLWPRIAAAAAILVFLSFGIYEYLHKNTKPKAEFANDIVPGTGKPFLTLANGQKIIVGTNKGVIAKQGNVVIQQSVAGQVSYQKTNAITDAPYNTLTNPRGGKVISLILPDGTTAKLDAASSITYQTAFTGKTRSVSTTGKVYFDVTYNAKQPFLVSTKGQITKDLGTHFIVEAFDDEPAIKTTLIEGSIAINGKVLKPGQQALGSNVRNADLDVETAWLNGDFDFNKQDLQSIMRELSRVYAIDVTFKDGVENLILDGMITRSHNISAVLEMIEATGKVHFEIQGRRVMVLAGAK